MSENLDLDAALRAAHAAGDGRRIARLYAQAAEAREAAGEIDAACFHLVHAYVFALEAGAPEAEEIRARLVAHGREA